MSNKIPKIIHYCWFGKNPLPDDAKKCIDSWKRFFPDYEIKEWNENNYDLNSCEYIKEAYKAKKWAFVSDYARFDILYKYGGLYFDTDVEVIKDMAEIVEQGSFMGTEPAGDIAPGLGLAANPGLGLAANPGLGLYKEMLNFYDKAHFINSDGSMNDQTVVKYTTDILRTNGFVGSGKIEKVCDITIYPPEFFCPKNYETGEINITENTYSIHHYAATWHSFWDDAIASIERCNNKDSIQFKIRRILSFPFRVINKIDKVGWKNTITFISKKMR